MSTSAADVVPPPPYNMTLKEVEKVNSSLTKGWKRHETPWREKPIPVPPPPPLDPVGERIRGELQRRRGTRCKVSNLPGLDMPPKMIERIDRNQRRFDVEKVGPARRINSTELRPSRRGFDWTMNQLGNSPREYWNDVHDDIVTNKAISMAKETLYLTQERIRLLDEYVIELQRSSGSSALLFNIGYTIKKMRALLQDCYTIYTVLFYHKFEDANRKPNVERNIYYYTFCFKKYIDIIYYVEAVIVAYSGLMKDG